MDQRERFEQIIASLLEAQLDDSRWPGTSALIDDACGLMGNHLSVIRNDPGKPPEMVFGKLYRRGEPDDELERFYVDNYLPIDERIPRFFGMPDGTLNHVNAIFTDEERVKSPTYNEFVVPTGAGNSLNVRLAGPDGLHIVWSLVRHGDPSWTSEHVEMVRKLLPHIRHFVRVRQALANAATGTVRITADALGTKRIGVVFLDRHGCIVEANDYARALLRTADGLTDRRGYLATNHAGDADTLAGLLAPALGRTVADTEGGTMSVHRVGRLPLALHVVPLAPHHTADFSAMGDGFAAMLLIVDPLDKPRVNALRVADALDLTPSQARIAAALASGSTVRSIAATSHRSEAVVRWHLKQIMVRLGLFGQTDLIRLVLTTPGVYDA